jgi:hypothetical protein
MEKIIIELLNKDSIQKNKKIVSEYLLDPMDFKSDFDTSSMNRQLGILITREESLVSRNIFFPGLNELVEKLKTLEEQEIIVFYAANITTRQQFSIYLDEKATDIYGLIEFYDPPPIPKWAHLCNPQ